MLLKKGGNDMKYSREDLLNALKDIKHPENGRDLVELGMVANLTIHESHVEVTIKFNKHNDPLAGSIKKACELALKTIVGDDFPININLDMPDSRKHITDQAETDLLHGVKNIIAIASGKGGVGKSTIAVNIAVAMARNGASVGLIDGDVYGPSIPKMFALENEQPFFKKVGQKEIMIPIEKYGVKVLSLGFFVKPEDALVWRGPMATSAIKQLINQADWGNLDYLFIDLPPGTGDIHLTLVQEVPVTGVVIVSTPQQIALADAIKGIAMFTGDKINVPVLGLVENMAWFTPTEEPEKKYYIFGRDGCKNLALDLGIELLGQIPIMENICTDGDSGRPSALDEKNPSGKAFVMLAEKLSIALEKRIKQIDPTRKVEITNPYSGNTAKKS